MISITKNHYELQIEGSSIKLVYYTDTIARQFEAIDSERGKELLKRFNDAYPRTSFTPSSFPSENLNIYS